jgi:hypothetical protein
MTSIDLPGRYVCVYVRVCVCIYIAESAFYLYRATGNDEYRFAGKVCVCVFMCTYVYVYV